MKETTLDALFFLYSKRKPKTQNNNKMKKILRFKFVLLKEITATQNIQNINEGIGILRVIAEIEIEFFSL